MEKSMEQPTVNFLVCENVVAVVNLFLSRQFFFGYDYGM